MSGSAFMVWDLPLTVMVKRWLMAFSSLNKIAGPVAYGLTVPFADASAPTLAGERLVPQTSLANTWRYKFGVNITKTGARSEASRNLR